MKQFFRAFALCLALFACLTLFACKDDGAPTGFRLASNPETDGFYLYVPEEWSDQRTSGTLTVYLSTLSSVNVTAAFVTTDAPDMETYWSTSEEELREDFPDFALSDGSPESRTVDGHTAYLYRYEGTYVGVHYGFEQCFVLLGETPAEGMYVLTYTASKDPNPNTKTVDYDETVANMNAIVQNFRIASSSPAPEQDLAATDADAPEGMKRANRFTRLGFDLFVPTDWRVDLSDGYVSAVASDGSSVGMYAVEYNAVVDKLEYYGTGVSENGFNQIDFWNLIQAEYDDYLSDFRVVEEPVLQGDDTTPVTPPTQTGECSYRRFIMEGSHAGVTYRVALYLLWETDGGRDLHLLTYTAKTDAFDSHMEEVERMLCEIRFS